MLEEKRSENQPQENFLNRLAQQLGGSANAATIFGAPIERGSVAVIPIAKVVYGFGGGGGTQQGEQGSGGGGGVRITPVGYIELRDSGALYKPIRGWATVIPAIAAGGLLALLAARGIAKLLPR